MRRILLVLSAALVAAGCGDDGGPDLPSRGWDVRSYELRGSFDWTARRLSASVDIVVVTGETSIDLDSAVEVTRVHAGSRELPFTADPEAGRLRIDLSALAPKTDSPVSFTIDYVAPTAISLVASTGRGEDPVKSRVVYTNSEPDAGPYWLPGVHHPDDRATFAVELTVAADEDLVANGARVSDQTTAAGRVVRYEMSDPIPTYIMAFAAGQLEHADRPGAPPLSLWYRRGLAIDPAGNLDAVAAAMEHTASLLGPYPFERYSVVLLPEFNGGMENATITFNQESSGQGNVSFNLNAHELAHQWFGDYVTVESFDDLWVKEGMATLLAAEADRPRRDAAGSGRLFGSDFAFDPRDKIQDLDLTLAERYTSGPYERSAWLLTQIRSVVGEDAFWRTLREILAEHGLGTIDGEGFIRAFAPELDEATIARAIAALSHAEVPQIGVQVSGATATLTLADPGAVLIAPITARTVDATGAPGPPVTLATDRPVSLTVPAGGYLALDERDVHPDWSDGAFSVPMYNALVPLLAPDVSGAALDAFLARSPAQQERSLGWGLPIGDAASLAPLYAALDSSLARRYAEIYACRQVAAGAPGWADATAPLLLAPALSSFTTSFSGCGPAFPPATFGAELAGMAAAPTPQNAKRLGYLLGFDYGAATMLDVGAELATGAPSLQLRDLAVTRLSYQISGFGYSGVPDADRPGWLAFFRARLAEVASEPRLVAVWRGIYRLRDVDALPAVAAKLVAVPMSASSQRTVVCQALTVAGGASSATWAAFQAAIPTGPLAPSAEEALRDPSRCSN